MYILLLLVEGRWEVVDTFSLLYGTCSASEAFYLMRDVELHPENFLMIAKETEMEDFV